MPQFGAVGVSSPGALGGISATGVISSTAFGSGQIFPSGSIWASCDGSSLVDNPDGFWTSQFWKDVPSLPALPSQNGAYTYLSSTDSALNIAYTSTGNATIFVKPMVPIAPNGPNKLWFEVSLDVLQSTAQQMFIGFATSTGLSSTLLATSTTLLSTCGLIGFWMHGDVPTNFDAIYQAASSGSVSTVLASTLTAGANNSDPGNPFFIPSTPPGALTGNQGFIKLGLKVDKVYAYWFVNGSLVAKKAIDTTFDVTDSYGAVVTAGTGTANTDNVALSFFKTAARLG